MKANRKVKRAARQLFRFCLVDGLLDQGRVRQVAQSVATSTRRGALPILSEFLRLVRLDSDRHTAVVESAAPLDAGMRDGIAAGLARVYGPGLEAIVRAESGAHRRDADQSGQRCLRRERAGPPGGARGTAVTSLER